MQNTYRIQHIDAWRFVAIALVLVSHVMAYSHPWYREHFLPIMWPLQKMGLFGVQIFFCISGYVICRGLMHERQSTGSVSIKRFYIRRFFRIVPPVVLYMLALVAFSLAGEISVAASQFAHAGLFLCNFDPSGCGWFLGHTWSLAYEEQFYVVFPLLFITFATAGARRSMAILTAGVMIASLAARFFSHDRVAEYASAFVFMLTGCVSAMYWHEFHTILKRMPLAVWVTLLFVTPLLACVIPLPDAIRYFFVVVVAPPAICVVVFGTPVSVPAVAKIFLNSVISHLGKVSFTIYLWQQLATANYAWSSPLFAIVALACVFLIALVSYRYFELPLIRLGNDYARVSRAKGATLPPVDQTASVL